MGKKEESKKLGQISLDFYFSEQEDNLKSELKMDNKTKEDKEEGFYCEICDCKVQDSSSYLDHKNGKMHNKNLGISLKKFTDSSLEEVKEMLELKRRQKYGEENLAEDEEMEEEDEEDEEERLRRKKREKKKRQKARKAESSYY